MSWLSAMRDWAAREITGTMVVRQRRGRDSLARYGTRSNRRRTTGVGRGGFTNIGSEIVLAENQAAMAITTIAATQQLILAMITVMPTEEEGEDGVDPGIAAGSRGDTRSGATPLTPVDLGTGAGQNGIIVTRLRPNPILG